MCGKRPGAAEPSAECVVETRGGGACADDAERAGLELGGGFLEGRYLSVLAGALDATAFRLPVGAPKEPRFWVACKMPEAASVWKWASSCCEALREWE